MGANNSIKRHAGQLQRMQLPEVVADLVQAIGWAAVIDLIEVYGGTLLIIPASVRTDDPLARVIGYAAASVLVQRYAGDRIYLARLTRQLREIRNSEIRARYSPFRCTARMLAIEYGLSDRQVWNIIAGGSDDETDDAQRSLW